MSLVERINIKCKENGTNIKALERDLGFGNGNIRRWDTQKPSYDKVMLVAEKLHVTFNWLITGKEESELTQTEQKLIDLYRNTNEIGQPLIVKHAEDIQKALPKAAEASPESSTSLIG